tara:strand:+ start:189 stop:755 length:567 start_codon:yes stop_codon:yes gene_type:complete
VSDKNKISDAELSLITAISSLDNKLEELDHNISLLSKQTQNSSDSLINDKKLNERINILEQKISKFDEKINKQAPTEITSKYLKTLPTKGRLTSQKKGYALAENLRLKRIESIEKSLNILLKKYDDKKLSLQDHNEVFLENIDKPNQLNFPSSDQFYLRSRGIFFSFIFSIFLVFLLIVVSTGINIFI